MVTMLKKISVQCGRELNFLHSDITVIILHGQILILYNWRPYLSITPRKSLVTFRVYLQSCLKFFLNNKENGMEHNVFLRIWHVSYSNHGLKTNSYNSGYAWCYSVTTGKYLWNLTLNNKCAVSFPSPQFIIHW